MPFFGKKEKKDETKSSQGYPTQAAYPTQPAYPVQQATAPPPMMQQGYAQAPPPPYGAPQQYQQYPGGPQPGYQYGAPPQPGMYGAPPPPAMYGAPPMYNPNPSTVVVQGGFDAGARFDGVAQPNIPPPPPGCMPNTAQVAAQQGHNVALGQRSSDFLTGGSDGGYVIF